MMCEGRREVKEGLLPTPGKKGRCVLQTGEAAKTGPHAIPRQQARFFQSKLPDAGRVSRERELCLVAGELDAAGLDGFGQSTADEAEGRSGSIPLWLKRKD
jgi:hypothetical protein